MTGDGFLADGGAASCRSARRDAPDDDGFTLVELIVALGLFAVLAAAGTGLVTTVADAGRRTAARADRLAAIERTLAIVDRDLTEAADAPLTGDTATLAFDRWREGGATTVGYALERAALVRRDTGRAHILLRGVTALRWHYLAGRAWQDRWPANPAQAARWPAAVALDLDLAGAPGGHLRRIVDLPARPLPPVAAP
ncbi:MAG: prepilin-type N-terminal cleavage/methylation domain-containing protein [Sphingomonadaceae bacterium]|nr:prepilin-type N-terminal cleavage/methylation domain-containing protein [Sphingomonadaceae bacterium]